MTHYSTKVGSIKEIHVPGRGVEFIISRKLNFEQQTVAKSCCVPHILLLLQCEPP